MCAREEDISTVQFKKLRNMMNETEKEDIWAISREGQISTFLFYYQSSLKCQDSSATFH